MNKTLLLMSTLIVSAVGMSSHAQAGTCKKSGAVTLSAKIKDVDRTKWGDIIKIGKTKGDCSVDGIDLENSAPEECTAGATVTATGKYEMVDMAGLAFEATSVRCR